MQDTTRSPKQFCLRHKNYKANFSTAFDQLLQNETFVDVTLVCDGTSYKAHKIVLSACSALLQTLLVENPCPHPIIIMNPDMKSSDLKAIVEFMYKGKTNVSQEQIGPLLKVAETLKIRGLADAIGEQENVAPATNRGGVSELTANANTLNSRASLFKQSSATSIMSNFTDTSRLDQKNNNGLLQQEQQRAKKRRRFSGEFSSSSSPAESASTDNMPDPLPSVEMMSPRVAVTGPAGGITSGGAPSSASGGGGSGTATPLPRGIGGGNVERVTVAKPLPLTLPLSQLHQVVQPQHTSADDMTIEPGIAEMIREEERETRAEESPINNNSARAAGAAAATPTPTPPTPTPTPTPPPPIPQPPAPPTSTTTAAAAAATPTSTTATAATPTSTTAVAPAAALAAAPAAATTTTTTTPTSAGVGHSRKRRNLFGSRGGPPCKRSLVREADKKPNAKAAKAKPAAAKSKPAAAKSKPSAAKSKPSAAKSKPAAAKSKPAAANAKPAAAKSKPAAAKSKPAAAKSKPAAARAKPAAANAGSTRLAAAKARSAIAAIAAITAGTGDSLHRRRYLY